MADEVKKEETKAEEPAAEKEETKKPKASKAEKSKKSDTNGMALPSFGRRPVCSTLSPSTIRMSGRSTSTHWFGITS
jgi:hypothetical protein